MNSNRFGKWFGAVAASLVVAAAQASPMTIEYQGIISQVDGTAIGGVAVGSSARFAVTFDNGGSSQISQTWGAADILSVTMDFGGGSRVTTFSTPFDGSAFTASGSYATDAAGVLTSVMTLTGFVVDADFTTNGPGTQFGWFINGINHAYQELGGGANTRIFLQDVGGDIVARNWAFTNSVPEPGTLALVGLALAGLGARRLRPRAAPALA